MKQLAFASILSALLAVSAFADDSWTNGAGGDWDTTTNWFGGTVPNGVGETATMDADLEGDTINIDTIGGITLGTLDGTTNFITRNANR